MREIQVKILIEQLNRQRIRKSVTLLLLVLSCLSALGQVDSVEKKVTGYYHALRVGVGYEKTPYAELGYSKLILHDRDADALATSYCFYGAAQVNFDYSNGSTQYIYGGKLGFESTIAWSVIWGAEIKYLVDHTDDWQLYFTPRLGLSKHGAMSLVAGLNMPKDVNIDRVGRYQISLTVNLSKRLFRDHL